MDAIPWQGDEIVLDVGCGSGNYLELGQAYGRTYLAGDLSLGMLPGLARAQIARWCAVGRFIIGDERNS